MIFCLHVCVCHPCEHGVSPGQKGVLGLLGLELQVVMRCHVDPWNSSKVLCKKNPSHLSRPPGPLLWHSLEQQRLSTLLQ